MKRIVLHIDRLVLNGFQQEDRQREHPLGPAPEQPQQPRADGEHDGERAPLAGERPVAQLLLAAETWFRERGASFVVLHTAMNMTPLVNYYLSQGFRLASVSDEKGYQRGKFVKPLV